MKFQCNNSTYASQAGLKGIFMNPEVVSNKVVIDPVKKLLEVTFSLTHLGGGGQMEVLESTVLRFTETGQDTMIDNGQGGVQEILEFLNGGGQYDSTKIVSWGRPSFQQVQSYFDLDSVWTDLIFKDQPLKFLAIDWLYNSLLIEGKPVKEYFHLVS